MINSYTNNSTGTPPYSTKQQIGNANGPNTSLFLDVFSKIISDSTIQKKIEEKFNAEVKDRMILGPSGFMDCLDADDPGCCGNRQVWGKCCPKDKIHWWCQWHDVVCELTGCKPIEFCGTYCNSMQ